MWSLCRWRNWAQNTEGNWTYGAGAVAHSRTSSGFSLLSVQEILWLSWPIGLSENKVLTVYTNSSSDYSILPHNASSCFIIIHIVMDIHQIPPPDCAKQLTGTFPAFVSSCHLTQRWLTTWGSSRTECMGEKMVTESTRAFPLCPSADVEEDEVVWGTLPDGSICSFFICGPLVTVTGPFWTVLHGVNISRFFPLK